MPRRSRSLATREAGIGTRPKQTPLRALKVADARERRKERPRWGKGTAGIPSASAREATPGARVPSGYAAIVDTLTPRQRRIFAMRLLRQHDAMDAKTRAQKIATGLGLAILPVGGVEAGTGSVLAKTLGGRLLARAATKPIKTLTIGTAAAHATGHLDMPKERLGPDGKPIKEAGVPIPYAPPWIRRAAKAAVDVGLYSGPALYEGGKAVVQDATSARHGDRSFTRSRKLGKEIGASIKHGVTHPTEPESFVQNLLLGLGAGNVLAHGVERGVAASRAPTLRSAITRKGHEGGSLLHTRSPGVRTGRLTGDTELREPGGMSATHLEPDAPILRPAHHLRAAWLNWRLSHPDAPLNRWAVGRAENVLARDRASAERVLTSADKNRITHLRNEAHKLDQPEHTASRLVYIEGRDPQGGLYALRRPEEVVARHVATERAYATRAWARGDKDGALMHLLEAAAIKDALPVLKAPSKRFRTALRQGARESRRGERADIERGHLDVAQAEARKAGIAFLHGRGAPPRALAGETRDAFLARARKTDRALRVEAERQKRKLKGALRENPSPELQAAREAEAAANQAAEAASAARGKALTTYQRAKAALARKEQTLLNEQTNPRGTAGGIAKRAREVQEAKRELKTARDDLVRLRREAPVHAQRLAELNRALNEQVGRERQAGAIAEHERRIGSVTAERARLAEEVAAAQGLHVPGATFFSTAEHFKLPMRSTKVRGAQTGAGTSIGPPSPGRYRFGSLRRFTGSGIERTGQVQRPITSIAELQAGRTIAHAQEDLYRELWQAASPRKTSEFQVAIRSTRTNPLDLKRLERAQRAADAGDETPLGEFIRARYDDLLVPEAETRLVEVGERIPGVKWIDKAYVKRLEPVGNAQSGLAKFARAINRPARFFGVYARPGYVATNKIGNEAMGIFLHGPRAFATGTRGKLRRSLGQEGLAIAEGVAGTTRTESYRMADLMRRNYAHAHPAGRALGQAGGAAAWLENRIVGPVTNLTDRSFRLRMFEIRAAQRGYTNASGVRKLLTSRDPAVRRDLATIGRRARKDAVDFDSLTHSERQLAELFYFWPWTSRAFVWTGRSMANRPLASGVLAAAAPVARERQPDWLKRTPDWMRGYVATSHGLINLNPVWTWATPAQTAKEAAAIAETALRGPKPGQAPRSFAGEVGTPVLQLAAGESGANIVGTSGLGNVLGLGRPGKAFPDNSLRARLKRFGGGSLVPRTPDREYLRESYIRDLPAEQRIRERAKALDPSARRAYVERELRQLRRKDLSPERKALLSVYDERQKLFEAAKASGMTEPRLPAPIRQAFTIKAQREAAYAKATTGVERATRAYQVARFSVDVDFLTRFGQIDAEERKQMQAFAAKATRSDLKAARRYISDHYYEPGFLKPIAEARAYLRDQGVKGFD